MGDSGGVGIDRRPRRRHALSEKRRIVELTFQSGASVAQIALVNGVNTNQVFKWRRAFARGELPATYKMIRRVRPMFACAGCERVVEAPAPSRPIERGLPGPSLLAHVPVSKYGSHRPLYRQSEILAREGVELDRSTLAGWVGAASELMTSLVDEIRKHVMAASKIHADDTPIPVLGPGNGKTRTGRLWTYVRDDRPAGLTTPPAVWFAYSEDRKGEHPRRHLKDFKGALQADAYAGLHHLYSGGTIYEVSCWAHARRKLHDIHVVNFFPTTTEALARIGALYGVEEEIRGKAADVRRGARLAGAGRVHCTMRVTTPELVT
jgi:transposase